jgi:hypothetical protein
MNADRRFLLLLALAAFMSASVAIDFGSQQASAVGDEAPRSASPATGDEAVPSEGASEDDAEPRYETVRLTGKVVWIADALVRRYKIRTGPEAAERVLALENDEGLFPLVEDVRGRAFRKDERLRGIDVELLVRRYEGSPMVQVIRVFARRDGKKYELDYWCDICAIAMFELKECECCQGPVILRERLVEGDDPSRGKP